uniref:Uncharacterized protein n=1 Tax=Anguilla anguilla TaxID=7936 RepID=A0A0E9VGT8_ANGAN
MHSSPLHSVITRNHVT